MICIGKYKIHPVATLFPLLEGEEYEKFKASIQEQGQLETIKVRGDLLIDGRNRLRACLDLGVEPRVEEFTGDDMAAGHYILAANLFRRHLRDDQRAFIGAKALRLIFAARAQARQVGAGKHGIEGASHGAEGGRGNKNPLDLNSDPGGFKRDLKAKNSNSTRGQMAQTIKTSRARVDNAIRVVDHGTPELHQQVEAGTIMLKDAVKQLPPPNLGHQLRRPETKLKSSQSKKDHATAGIEAGLMRCAALPQPVKAQDIILQFQQSYPKDHKLMLKTARKYLDWGRLLEWFHVELVSSSPHDIWYRITVDHDLKNMIDDYRPVGPRGESQAEFLDRLESLIKTCLEEQEFRSHKPWNVENSSKMALLHGLLNAQQEIKERRSYLQAKHNPNHDGQNSTDKNMTVTSNPN
jgi:hypothetical protein